jgi:hypothetical protein
MHRAAEDCGEACKLRDFHATIAIAARERLRSRSDARRVFSWRPRVGH